MDIGTAKIKPEQTEGIKHHLIDVLEPTTAFSVREYQTMVRDKIQEVQARNKTPLIVGGSGLYLQAALYDYRFVGEKRSHDDHVLSMTNEEMHANLTKINPQIAETIHPNNRRRLIRALELHGSGMASMERLANKPFYPNLIVVGLRLPRTKLYELIEKRVDQMIEAGLVLEIRKLLESGVSQQSLQAIGYKELIGYLNNEKTLEEAVTEIKLHSRRYAKRQMTWFNNQMDVVWFDVEADNLEQTSKMIISYLKKS
jgi:tRNA dimethylallyltransferase